VLILLGFVLVWCFWHCVSGTVFYHTKSGLVVGEGWSNAVEGKFMSSVLVRRFPSTGSQAIKNPSSRLMSAGARLWRVIS